MTNSEIKHGGAGTAYAHYGCRCDECRAANTARVARRRAERIAAPKDPDDPRHGSVSFYSNHGCRCDKCSAAHQQKMAAGHARRRNAAKDPNDPRHGTYNFYTSHGCRCEKCKEAARIAYQETKQRNAA